MKRFYFFFAILLFSTNSNACEFCGCSSGNYFLGPMPIFQRHFIGIRYSSRSFETRIKNDHSQFSKDFYQTTELWGGWNISKKIQLLVFVPYNINKQSSDDGSKINKGMGDITLITNYSLFSQSKINSKGKLLKQQFWIGAGLKLPTGKFKADSTSLVPSANNQAGTGSFDYILNGTYSVTYDRMGISTNISYKLNGNSESFHFGNKLSANVFGSYSFPTAKIIFTPYVGMLYENQKINEASKIKIEDTGGRSLLYATGIEINVGKFGLGANFQLPLKENLSGNQTHTIINSMVHLNMNF